MDLNLDNIGLGAVSEKFDEEVAKAVKNILDPNTEVKVVRKISIEFKIKPNPENREMCSMEVIVNSKLAPTKTLSSILHVGISTDGEVNAIESVPQQQTLFPDGNGEEGVEKQHQLNG